MNLANAVETIPLMLGDDGVVRIGNTRVTLSTLVCEFENGMTAEEIAAQFDTLALADIYAVLTYYLRHPVEVSKYLQEQEQEAHKIRQTIEQAFPSTGLKGRLLARRKLKSKVE